MSQETMFLPPRLIIIMSLLFCLSYSAAALRVPTPNDVDGDDDDLINNNQEHYTSFTPVGFNRKDDDDDDDDQANNNEGLVPRFFVNPRVHVLHDRYHDHRADGGGLVPRFFPESSGVVSFSPDQSAIGPHIVNVDDFGAKGDGTDDTEAFKRAWKIACWSRKGVFLVPANRIYHLKPITFSGPCKRDFTMVIRGQIRASNKQSDYGDRRFWLLFQSIDNFRIQGGGIINGNGQIWWKDSCKINTTRPCQDAPTAVTFNECNNLRVCNLRFRNSQQIHLQFKKCENVRVSHVRVNAPGKSPNTDGIHVSATQNILISKSVIRTGDDCISIVSGSKNIQVYDIICGPGHGISIGSLGKNRAEDQVSDVVVDGAILSGTTNGVRIKSWQGGSGYANNIKFQNILMHNVTNPIIIDQNYCDRKEACPPQYSAVQVENVVYKNIIGTSSSQVAMKLDCSKTFPCRGIQLQNIDLQLEQDNGDDATALCRNVRLLTRGSVSPGCSC